MSFPREVLIIGGVAGGMSCATRLRRLDETARITVLERGPHISYANCGIPYALGGVIASEASLSIQTPEKIESWFDIKVRTNTELVRIDRETKTIFVRRSDGREEEELRYDVLVLAMGAEPFLPRIDGVEKAFLLHTIPDLEHIKEYIRTHECRNATVVGGGFIGLEVVENLHRLGLHVQIVEFLPHVFPPLDSDLAEILHSELRRKGIDLFLNSQVSRITDTAIHTSSGTEIPTDLAIIATGVRPRTKIAEAAGLASDKAGLIVNEAMQTSDPDIYAVGDMIGTTHLVTAQRANVALAGPANREGRIAADHIANRDFSAYGGSLGTAVCQVFDLSVGIVGLSNDALERADIKHEFVTVHPAHHAGYYPGATPLTLRLSFENPSGKILGAQAVGANGVDKRIDVIATAMRGGLTVFDLENLELAYAPPYGSAKDPVNMAGFVASNVLRGDVRVVHASDLVGAATLGEFQVVDVRSREEFDRGHVVGAVNLPLGELRAQLETLDRSKKVLVYCWVGYRGYLAYRVLVQGGFDVYNLDGGFKSVSEGGFKSLVVS